MGGWRAGGKAERWSYHRGGTGEAQQTQLVGQPILEGEVPPYVCGGLGTGVPPMAGGGHLVERPPHPAKALSAPGCRQRLPLAGGVGRRVPVTTSPRLELELSPDLLCGWGSKGTGGEHGRAGGRGAAGLQLGRSCVPCSSAPHPHLHTPPPRKATGSSGAPPKIAMPHPLQADTWS